MFKFVFKFLSFIITFTIAVLVYYFVISPDNDGDRTGISEGDSSTHTVLVKKVIDGDTFILDDDRKVRLLGIDAPERYDSGKLDRDADNSGVSKKVISRLGKLSGEFLTSIVEGRRVRLEREPDPDYEDEDKYGRLLRYSYLEDGTFINGEMVKEGYCLVYEKYYVSKTPELRTYQREAKEKGKGLWGEIPGLEQLEN